MNRDLIQKTEAFLRQKFDEGAYLNAHPAAKAYRLAHSFRVANIGRQIAASEGFDETAFVLACLLHDVSYCEEFGEDGWLEHGRRSAKIARPFLEALGLPEAQIGEICYGIAIHVDDQADFPGERTPFALSVGDADNIDRTDAYRIHETLVHDGFLEMRPEQQLTYAENRVARLQELLSLPMATKTAQTLWNERISFYIAYCQKLLAQLQSSRSVADGAAPHLKL